MPSMRDCLGTTFQLACPAMKSRFTLFAVLQDGRLAYEAIILAASLAATNPGLKLTLAEPQPGPLWDRNPRPPQEIKDLLAELGAEIIPFENKVFGSAYPHGNKIEALFALPIDAPFLFLDTDTLVLGDLAKIPFDFNRPTASLKREATWPKGPDVEPVWRSLYERFGLDFDSSQDLSFPIGHWERYLYFNAGFFFYKNPTEFGHTFREFATEILNNPSPALDGQKLDPWLDQIALPLTIHALGGGRDAALSKQLDEVVTCHYRTLPLLYARESSETIELLEEITAPNRIKKVLKDYEPAKKLIYQGLGREIHLKYASQAFDTERELRKALKADGFWLR